VASIPWDYMDLVKLLIAVALGFAIGWEREIHHRPAGLKTITFVTLASTLFMELSIKLSSLGIGPPGSDPARLAAAVITGIGFLGAGVIFQAGGQLQGITTAATIWLMTGVGLAVGAGYYVPALATCFLILVGFSALPVIERAIARRAQTPPPGNRPTPPSQQRQ